MGMPLDLYVIRHGESEANVIISAGEQGDNSLYTQDNVTVPDRSWRLTRSAASRRTALDVGWFRSSSCSTVIWFRRTCERARLPPPCVAESEMGGNSRAS